MNRRQFLQTTAAGLSVGGCSGSVDFGSEADPFSDPAIRPLLETALTAATEAGARYADARLSHHRDQRISTREARVTRTSDTRSTGIGIRVLFDGTWGFAATPNLTTEAIVATAQRAIDIARSNSQLQQAAVRLAPIPPQVGRWETPIKRDAFDVPLKEKVDRLLSINALATKHPGIRFANSSMHFVREHKYLATTEGTWIEQVLHRCNPTFRVTSVDDRLGSFRSRNALCAPQGRGYDFIDEYDWEGDVQQAAEDAVALHTAKRVEPGKTDLVLMPSHLWLTIHESIGHPTELDRAMGLEANYAGTSFLTPDQLGKIQIAAPHVNFTAERTTPGGLATAKWDDDGAPTESWPLIKDGVFVDYQTTRDQAHWINQTRGHACSYAQSWRDVAFQRMPNINLLPGTKPLTLDQLIGDTERGILIAGRGSYSIDHQRYNFQFGGQTFHEIRNGAIVGPLADVAYQSNTTEFWNACDAVCSEGYEINGSFYDGKGQPGQVNAVSHGCPPARFRNIDVLRTGGAA